MDLSEMTSNLPGNNDGPIVPQKLLSILNFDIKYSFADLAFIGSKLHSTSGLMLLYHNMIYLSIY
jgi:hypothetical protein